MTIRTLYEHSVRMAIHFFVNFDVFKFNTKLGDFVNLGVFFLTMWINSCLSHTLAYRLVPSPFRLEIRQLAVIAFIRYQRFDRSVTSALYAWSLSPRLHAIFENKRIFDRYLVEE